MLQAVGGQSVVGDVNHFHILVKSDAAHQASPKEICEVVLLEIQDTKT